MPLPTDFFDLDALGVTPADLAEVAELAGRLGRAARNVAPDVERALELLAVIGSAATAIAKSLDGADLDALDGVLPVLLAVTGADRLDRALAALGVAR